MSKSSLGAPEYLMFSVLEEIRSYEDRPVPKTEFHKLCYLTDKGLIEDDIDIKLPQYWYQFGGVVALEVVDSSILHEESFEYDEHSGFNISLAPQVTEDDFETDGGIKAEIDHVASEVVHEYADGYGVKRIQDDQYLQFAPEDFVRVFHNFRTILDKADEGDQRIAEIQELLGEFLKTYPDRYSRMRSEFLEWEHLMRQLLKLERHEDIQRFAGEFWKTISDVELRIQHHDHLPDWLINRWRNEVVTKQEEFDRELNRYRDVVQGNREDTDVLDDVAESYSKTVWRLFNEG